LARKKRLTKAQIKKRENIKWSAMFVMTIITTALYFRVFIEMEKTQNSIDFKQKTLAQLNEDLIIKLNSVERMKRADIISKKAKKIGLIYSEPETLIVKISND
tara:strand:+ start:1042 stop:1350 length:309 start_codon:yes stop_codon:yes gene_type:complete